MLYHIWAGLKRQKHARLRVFISCGLGREAVHYQLAKWGEKRKESFPKMCSFDLSTVTSETAG